MHKNSRRHVVLFLTTTDIQTWGEMRLVELAMEVTLPNCSRCRFPTEPQCGVKLSSLAVESRDETRAWLTLRLLFANAISAFSNAFLMSFTLTERLLSPSTESLPRWRPWGRIWEPLLPVRTLSRSVSSSGFASCNLRCTGLGGTGTCLGAGNGFAGGCSSGTLSTSSSPPSLACPSTSSRRAIRSSSSNLLCINGDPTCTTQTQLACFPLSQLHEMQPVS